MKLTIDCTDEQAQLLLNCLEESFRFRMQQSISFLSIVTADRGFDCEKYGGVSTEMAEGYLRSLMTVLYGAGNTKLTDDTQCISDMWSVIRHEIYIANGGEKDTWDVRSSKPIKLGDLPMIKVEVENGKAKKA